MSKVKGFTKVVLLSAVVLFSYTGVNQTKSFAKEGDDVKFVNNNNIVITNSDYQRLESLGFTYDQILTMDSKEYSLNEGLSGKVISKSTEYIKVVERVVQSDENIQSPASKSSNLQESEQVEPTTEVVEVQEMTKEDFEREVAIAKKKEEGKNNSPEFSPLASDSDFSQTSYKTMTTSVVDYGFGEYRVKNDVHWFVTPKNRDFDVIGVAVKPQWAGNKNTEYGRQTWKLYNFQTKKTTTGKAEYYLGKNRSYWDIDGDGFSVKMNLKDDDKILLPGSGYQGYEVRDLDLYMYYNVSKAVNKPARIDAYGRYAHAKTKLKPGFGFSVSTTLTAGFSFSLNTVKDFDITKNTVATIIF
ncbi:hypothetical protein ACQKCU_23740 [Heyndrickxia sporothermodurans]